MQVIESLLQRDLFQETFYPLGFPVEIVSNSEDVLKAAHLEWDAWTQEFDEPPIVLSFNVSQELASLPETSAFHADGDQFVFIADQRNFGVCNTRTQRGAAWLTL